MRSKLVLSERVRNKDRRFGYYPAQIVTGFLRRPALFTPAQLSEAMRRAEENPEDMPKPTHWERLRAWLVAR